MINDRTKRIREHLAKSSGGEVEFQRIPQNYNNRDSSNLSSNKISRQEHLTRSLGNYDFTSGSKQAQKQRIMDHVRISRG